MASYITTQAKTTARAKAGPPVPCCRAIAATRAITVAECDDGIPPESSILFESHLFSLYQVVKTLRSCATAPARIADSRGRFDGRRGDEYDLIPAPEFASEIVITSSIFVLVLICSNVGAGTRAGSESGRSAA